MAFLITGATGFIGQYVVRSALEQAGELAIITRSVDDASRKFGNKNITYYDLQKILSDKERPDTKKFGKLLHLAWADVKNYMDPTNLNENLDFQKKFLSKLIDLGIKDVTAAGTCLEYGLKQGVCKESDKAPEEYSTTYAQAKASLHNYLQGQFGNKIDLKWLRFFYLYGVGSRSNSLLSQLLSAIENKEDAFNMSPGDQLRDFINVDTLSHNIVAVAAQNQQRGTINIANGKPISVEQFILEILNIKNYKIKLNKGFYQYPAYEPKDFWADVEKLGAVKGSRFDDKIWL